MCCRPYKWNFSKENIASDKDFLHEHSLTWEVDLTEKLLWPVFQYHSKTGSGLYDGNHGWNDDVPGTQWWQVMTRWIDGRMQKDLGLKRRFNLKWSVFNTGWMNYGEGWMKHQLKKLWDGFQPSPNPQRNTDCFVPRLFDLIRPLFQL